MNEITPNSTIGILGSGQLGRMLAVAARQMGYRVHVLLPKCDTLAGRAGAKNAALVAIAILGNKYPEYRDKLEQFRQAQTEKVLNDVLPIGK